MQIYKGLDISTAKATNEEQLQAVHHLLDVREACTNLNEPYTVMDFRDSALPIIERLLRYDKIPIIVGGTNYYIESILWKVLVMPPRTTGEQKRECEDTGESASCSKRAKHNLGNSDDIDGGESSSQIEELSGMSPDDLINKDPEYLHGLLTKVDPVSAQRLHPNDTRKVRRALEVYMELGQRISDVHASQRDEEGSSYLGGPLRYDNAILFWIKSDQETLNNRIDKRIDGMVAEGVLSEIRLFYNSLKAAYAETASNADAPSLDCTKGMMQAIGFKEFLPYLEAYPDAARDTEITEFIIAGGSSKSDGPRPDGIELLEDCLETLRLRTKRYSKKQIKWVTNRFVATKGRHVPLVYPLDSTNAATKWDEDVFRPAENVVQAYLDGVEPKLQPIQPKDSPRTGLDETVTNFCTDCNRRFIGEYQWNLHRKSNIHKKIVAKRRRLAELKKRNELLDQIKMDWTLKKKILWFCTHDLYSIFKHLFIPQLTWKRVTGFS